LPSEANSRRRRKGTVGSRLTQKSPDFPQSQPDIPFNSIHRVPGTTGDSRTIPSSGLCPDSEPNDCPMMERSEGWIRAQRIRGSEVTETRGGSETSTVELALCLVRLSTGPILQTFIQATDIARASRADQHSKDKPSEFPPGAERWLQSIGRSPP
jgi:hypothetical protein